MSGLTPAQLRSAARVGVAKLLRGALHEHDVDQSALARLVGTTAQKVQRWCDRESPESPYVADLPQMPRAVALTLLSWAAEAHHAVVVDELTAASPLDHMGHLHRIMREGSDVSTTYVAALADGVIDPSERERLISEVRESIAAQRALLEMLERERGTRLRGVS